MTIASESVEPLAVFLLFFSRLAGSGGYSRAGELKNLLFLLSILETGGIRIAKPLRVSRHLPAQLVQSTTKDIASGHYHGPLDRVPTTAEVEVESIDLDMG
jgi:hypothetical protein